MAILFTFIGSLIVALLAVWVSLRWSAKSKDRRALTSLRSEISTNIIICEAIAERLEEEFEYAQERKHGITPLPRLHTWTWNIARSTIMLGDQDASWTLQWAYVAADIVNSHVQKIKELKYGAVAFAKNIKEMRQDNCVALKSYIRETAIPASKEAEDAVDKELSKYKWWRL